MDGTGTLSAEVVLRAIAEAKTELAANIATSHRDLTTQLTELRDDYHSFLVEQAAKNASFASREQLQAVSDGTKVNEGLIASNTRRIEALEGSLHAVEAQVDTVEAALREKTIQLLTTTAGYIFAGLCMSVSAILGFVLSHLKP